MGSVDIINIQNDENQFELECFFIDIKETPEWAQTKELLQFNTNILIDILKRRTLK